MGNEIQTTEKSEKNTVKDWLSSDSFRDAVKSSLPSHLTPDRFVRVALTAMMRVPKLAQCSKDSLFKALLDLSSLGLEPDGRRAHLIPYENRKNGTVEVQLIIDYKGLLELSKRSGEVKSWRAELVCKNDEFRWETGKVTHEINWRKDRGEPECVYSCVKTKDDIDDFEVMTIADVTKIRDRSQAWKSYKSGYTKTCPWESDFGEMAKKTVMRRHSKRLTLSPEFVEALEKDHDKLEDIPTVSYEDIMPKRLSEVVDTPKQEPIVIEKKQEQKENTSLSIPRDPTAQISNAETKMILDAMAKNPSATKDVVLAHIKNKYGASKLSELKVSSLDDILFWIDAYNSAPAREVGEEG